MSTIEILTAILIAVTGYYAYETYLLRKISFNQLKLQKTPSIQRILAGNPSVQHLLNMSSDLIYITKVEGYDGKRIYIGMRTEVTKALPRQSTMTLASGQKCEICFDNITHEQKEITISFYFGKTGAEVHKLVTQMPVD